MNLRVIDCEGTGLDLSTDRLLSLAVVNASVSIKTRGITIDNFFFHPPFPIPEESTAIHGITNEQAAKFKTFDEQREEVLAALTGMDMLGGFNLAGYDVPMLSAEFDRCGIVWPAQRIRLFDAHSIFRRKEERTLSAALKFYCEDDLHNAHTAEADAVATYRVMVGQVLKYGESFEALADLSTENMIDYAGKFLLKDGVPIYNFSKHKGTPVSKELGLLSWMHGKNFPAETMRWVSKFEETRGEMPEKDLFS